MIETTHDTLEAEVGEVRNAVTALTNAEMELSGTTEELLEIWGDFYTAASRLSDAAEALVDAARKRVRAAEEATP